MKSSWKFLWQELRAIYQRKGPIDFVIVLHCGDVPRDFEGESPVPVLVFGRGECPQNPQIQLISTNGVLPHPSGLHLAHFTQDSLPFSVSEVPDILLTDSWPAGFQRFLTDPPRVEGEKTLSEKVAGVAKAVSPRYHFAAAAEEMYCRPAYKSGRGWCTRFVALGAVQEGSLQDKYSYLLEIQGLEATPPNQLQYLPPDCTECPYSPPPQATEVLLVENLPRHVSKGQLFRYFSAFGTIKEAEVVVGRHTTARLTVPLSESTVICESADGGEFDGRKISVTKVSSGPVAPRKQLSMPKIGCWFCLASPKCEEKLVVEVYEHWYAAGAKGPIADSHFLLVPIAHVSSRSELTTPAKEELEKLITEKLRLKLQNFLTFESSRAADTQATYHFYINVLQLELEQTEWVAQRFSGPISLGGYEFQPAETVAETQECTMMSLWKGEKGVHQVMSRVGSGNETGDLSRKSVCLLISKEALIDWRRCHDPSNEDSHTSGLRELLR